MGKVIAGFAMSLDGFIADAQDGVHRLYQWLMKGGDTPLPMHGRVFMTSAVSAAYYQSLVDSVGAHITGRRDFDISEAWQGTSPLNVHSFIVTHSVPAEWANHTAFTFVTDGIESAFQQARKTAGEKHVLVGGSQITQQALRAGLIDELQIDLVPVLLGEGIRLFGPVETPIELEQIRLIAAPNVTHLTFRVIK